MQRGEPERILTDSQRDEFEDMLRALTLERSQIKDAMGFSLDNADAASEVCNLCWFHCVEMVVINFGSIWHFKFLTFCSNQV